MSDNLGAWTKAHDNRLYYAQRLADSYINGDTAEVERFAGLYRKADEDMTRLDIEYMGEQK
jgi:hypothetical protein